MVEFDEEGKIGLELSEVVSDGLDGEGGCAVNPSESRLNGSYSGVSVTDSGFV